MRRFLLTFAMVVCAAVSAQAQVAVAGTPVSNGTFATGPSVMLSAVNGGGGNAIAICATWRQDAAQTITVTYGGSSTGITVIQEGVNNGRASALYYLLNAAGTEDIVITASADVFRIYGTAVVLSGVNTSAPITDSDETSITGTSSTLTLTTAADEMIVDCFSRAGSSETVTIGANQTLAGSQTSGSIGIYQRSSYQDGADGGEMSWTWTTGADAYHAAASFAAAAVSAPRTLLLLGVGGVQ